MAPEAEESDNSFDNDGGVFPGVLGRPWAGSTDCLHTMIYYEIYDRTFFRLHPIECEKWAGPADEAELLECSLAIPGVVAESPFDVRHIVNERRAFVLWLRDLLKVPEEPTLAKLEAWSATRELLPRMADGTTYWIRSGERLAQLDKLAYRLLKVGSESKLPLGTLLTAVPEALHPRLITFVRELGRRSLIRIVSPRPAEAKAIPRRQVPLPPRRLAVPKPPVPPLPLEPPRPRRLPSLPVVT